MFLLILVIFLYICLSIQKSIKNGIYNLISNNLYLNYYRSKLGLSDSFKYPDTFFRIKKISKMINNSFYYIEELFNESKITYIENKELNFSENNNQSFLWSFIKVNNTNYAIKNSDNCYIQLNKLEVLCANISIEQATLFQIQRIFSETKDKNSSNYLEILNKEPIDVLIKYIDLNDPYLNREGIHQIEKDYDNEELRYSVRSILDNIPWVRKIFIVMPNERVRYFKDYNLIEEKIVYVKDKDLLGYDSSNCNAFLFRYWKMKKFGISDNIIVMDDDYFIGSKLEKSDFFYVQNGKVVPLIITWNFEKLELTSVQNNCDIYEIKANSSKEEQNNDAFLYSKYLTYSFLFQIFNISCNESIYVPHFSHNAIPVNLNEIKEIYDLAYMSKYKYASLDCLYRIEGYLQFQILIQSYTFHKYKRKVKNIPHKFIQLSDSISADYNNIFLFCINKGSGNYTYLQFYKAKLLMEYLFPVPSPYEITDNSMINLSYNIVYSMDKLIKNNNNNSNKRTYTTFSNKKSTTNLEENFALFFIFVILKVYYRTF